MGGTLSPGDQRRRALKRGLRAETMALLFLMLKGYRPLARRYGGKGGEIDLIVRRRRAIVFVEVKARDDLDSAAQAIGPAKRRVFTRAAAHWLTHNPWAASFDLRADAVLVVPRRLPRHIVCAFELKIG
ncbi:putative endonuclease [Rhizobiales bacterium GAS191]|nr:putative endonuclease [Rhizobiales bacterium GAS113]SEC63671.1 putative endonuclease [Rhizobiales bacterium GAS191]